MFERTIKNIPRTTNSTEGFHWHLISLVRTKQSSFYLIVKELIIEQSVGENKPLGSLYDDTSIFIETDKKTKDTLKNYGENYSVEFLKKIVFSFN